MWKKIIITKQVINSQKQTLLNTKTNDQMLLGKKFLENAKYAFNVVRKTPYIDNMSLKANYIENREAYHQKMNHAFVSRTSNLSVEAFDNLFSAVEYNDTSTLWEEKQVSLRALTITR